MLILNYSAKLVQTERNAKQKTKFFVCITEVQPHLAISPNININKSHRDTAFLLFFVSLYLCVVFIYE